MSKRPSQQYQGRKFCAIDGEGVEGKYVLLADSEGEAVENIDGLSTRQCLEFLGRRLPRRASWTRVGFGLTYDINHWVSDLPGEDRLKLFAGDVVTYERWQLQLTAGRIFTIKSGKDHLATIYDCLGLFRRPFTTVCQEWLGSVPEIIVEGKKKRERFSRFDLDFMRAYNAEECRLLVRILGEVREFLANVPGGGVDLRGWYGAGAIAASWLRRAGARRLMRRFDERNTPADLLDAFAGAYHGGRVEAFAVGTFQGVYRYDINSAYAWAASHMGRLSYRWLPVETFTPSKTARMSVWFVRWNLPFGTRVGPLPVRDQLGGITYPLSGSGWYWWPEVKAARDVYGTRRIRVERGWLCEEGHRPLGTDEANLATVLTTMYQYRHWIRPHHPHGARLLKLGLAAVWGKFAQRHSATNDDEPGYYFCLPWAGWITSMVRASVLMATKSAGDAIVAISTDGIVATRELDVSRGDNLGAWRLELHERGTFLLPGLFRLQAFDGGENVEKTRGFAQADIQWRELLAQLNAKHEARVIVRRFIGHVLPDLWPELEPHRLQFVKIPVTIRPASILAKRLGGDLLTGDFRFDRDHVLVGAHQGSEDFVSWPMQDEDIRHKLKHDAETAGDSAGLARDA